MCCITGIKKYSTIANNYYMHGVLFSIVTIIIFHPTLTLDSVLNFNIIYHHLAITINFCSCISVSFS